MYEMAEYYNIKAIRSEGYFENAVENAVDNP